MGRIYSFPKRVVHRHCFSHDADIKAHDGYRAAKAGDDQAAFYLVRDLATDFLRGLQSVFPGGVNDVSPYATEAAGDNAIPLLLSLLCAHVLDGDNETDIVQQEKVFHTGADPMERLILRPSFEGKVTAGAQYVLVDDVTSMGGTLAELANFIRMNGGRILGSIVLVNAGRVKEFSPTGNHVRILEERFDQAIKDIFGIHISALTANEAGYLVGFRTVDEIRNRCIKAEKETTFRLLSKKTR